MYMRKSKNKIDNPMYYLWDNLLPKGVPKNFNIYDTKNVLDLQKLLNTFINQSGGEFPKNIYLVLMYGNYVLHVYYNIQLYKSIPNDVLSRDKIKNFVNKHFKSQKIRIIYAATLLTYLRAPSNALYTEINRYKDDQDILMLLGSQGKKLTASGMRKDQQRFFNAATKKEDITQYIAQFLNDDQYKTAAGKHTDQYKTFSRWLENYVKLPREKKKSNKPEKVYKKYLEQLERGPPLERKQIISPF